MARSKDLLNVGDRIEIIREGTKDTQSFPSQVLDIIGNENYIISGPIHKRNMVPLYKGENIDIAYLVENRGMFLFNAIIVKRDYDPIYKLTIKKVSDIKKYQNREYYRFEISIPIIKELFIETEDNEKIITEKCKTRNISGGGLNLLSNYKHNIGDKIVCDFYINEQNLRIKSEILRIDKIDTFDYNYSLGVRFLDINERERDAIIKFIFEEERIMREKGLI